MAPRPEVTLYGRPGCHLCDDAERLLRRLAPRLGLTLVIVDIESDDQLLQRYMLEIPVVTIAGREIARAPIDPAALDRDLRTALRR